MAKNDNTILIVGLGAVGLAALLFSASNESKPKGESLTNYDKMPKKLSAKEFVSTYYPAALASQKTTQVPALVTLAQAAIESNLGANAYGNNFFGIKADKFWTGQTQLLRTWECGKTGDPVKDGIKDQVIAIYPPGDSRGICGKLYSYRVYGKFRKYSNPEEGFYDHGIFLRINKRYANAFNYTDPKLFTNEIAKAGYATAPNYAQAVNSIIDDMSKIVTA